jgi:hypothetical protein
LQKEEYLAKAMQAGFTDIQVDREREIALPEVVLAECLTTGQIQEFRSSGTRILSINLYGRKPTT